MFTRREFFGMSSAAAVLNTAGSLRASEAALSLKGMAQKSGVLFGAGVLNSALGDSKAREQILRHCSILTPVGTLKWDALRPEPAKFDFTGGDAFVQFTEQNHLIAHGHTLLWHEALPRWFPSVVNASNAAAFLTEHIRTVVGRYREKIQTWDVVNEIVEPNSGRPDGLLDSPWVRFLGPECIDQAFDSAHTADPAATLVWNENNLELDTAYSRAKRRAVLRLLPQLLKRHVPIQAIGLQAHLRPTFRKTNRDYSDFLRALKDIGVKLLISELDVIDTDLPAADRDERVAGLYYDFLSTTCRIFKPVSIQVWELSDYRNWMDVSMPNWRRADGLSHRPAVLDSDFMPKPAFARVQQVLQEIE
jgi:endo-1,4-beta-xylanase